MKKDVRENFVVYIFKNLFTLLGYISIFKMVCIVIKKIIGSKKYESYQYFIVDIWVLSNVTMSIIGSLIVHYNRNNAVTWIFLVYAIVRVFEIIVYQINVMLFDPLRKRHYSIKSGTRMLILLLINYIEIIFWYSIIVVALLHLNHISYDGSWITLVQNSFLTSSVFNSDGLLAIVGADEKPLSFIAYVANAEIFSGLIITILSIARCIGLLPSGLVDNTTYPRSRYIKRNAYASSRIRVMNVRKRKRNVKRKG